jgi:NADPH:quinone reductase-like Zn-dependent oxidoreductase
MKGAVLYGPRDVRFEERSTPKIIEPTDAIVRTSATCVCGSDLWRFRGINAVTQPTPMGHEYCGIVQEVGSAVTTIKPGVPVRPLALPVRGALGLACPARDKACSALLRASATLETAPARRHRTCAGPVIPPVPVAIVERGRQLEELADVRTLAALV